MNVSLRRGGTVALLLLGMTCPATAGVVSAHFRLVERTGQTIVTPGDNVLDFALEVRVTGGHGLANGAATIRIHGEPESNGVLARGRISNVDGTYFPGIGVSNIVGQGGLAAHYAHLAQIDSAWNGRINTSSGTFVNGPFQEIGEIGMAAIGDALLRVPGLDADGDGNPDTWSGNGSNTVAPSGSVADVPEAAKSYFGFDQYTEVYRFRYTVSNLQTRTLDIRVDDLIGTSFFQFRTATPGFWGAAGGISLAPAGQISSSGLMIQVVPNTGTAACIAFLVSGSMARRRR